MKIFPLLFLCVCYQAGLFSQMELKNFKKSLITFFSHVDLAADTIPEEYFLPYAAFDSMCISVMDHYSKEKVQKQYGLMHRNAKLALGRVVSSNSGNIQFQMIDTVTYFNKGQNFLRVFIESEKPFLMVLYLFERNLYVSSDIREGDKRDYYVALRSSIQDQRSKAFQSYISYSPTSSSLLKVLPYKKSNLIGFISLESKKIVVEAQFDTIWPFKDNYWRVHRGDGYNLLDTTLNLLFEADKKSIVYRSTITDGSYYAFSDDGIKYGDIKFKENTLVSEDISDEREVSEKKISAKPMSTRITELNASLEAKHTEMEEEVNCVSKSLDGKKVHFIITKENDTLLILRDYKVVYSYGSVLVCRNENDISFDVLSRTGELLFESDFMEEGGKRNGCISLFNIQTRKFGLFAVYTNTYIEPIYDFIKPIEQGLFYMALKNGVLIYLDKSGQPLQY